MSFDRERFIKILARLGSDQIGEVQAAAHMALQALKAAGLTWTDVIGAPGPQTRPQASPGAAQGQQSPFYGAYSPNPNQRPFWEGQGANPRGFTQADLDEQIRNLNEILRRRQAWRDREYEPFIRPDDEGMEGWTHHGPHDYAGYKGPRPGEPGFETPKPEWDKAPFPGEAHIDVDEDDAQGQVTALKLEGHNEAQCHSWYAFAVYSPTIARWLFAKRRVNTFNKLLFEHVLLHGDLTPAQYAVVGKLMKK